MRLLFSLSFCILVIASIHRDAVDAQTTQATVSSLPAFLQGIANPLDLFTFKPKEFAAFLWDSIKPGYRSNIENGFRNFQNFGNASQFIVNWAEMFLGKNTTDMILNMPIDVPKLLDIFDSEMLNLFQNINLQNVSTAEIFSRLATFDSRVITTEVMNQLLGQLQITIPNITDKANSTIYKLENNMTIVTELTDEVAALGLPRFLFTNMIPRLDVALRKLVTGELMTDPKWMNMSTLGKFYRILAKFDYGEFGKDFMTSSLQAMDASLPADEKLMLRNFFVKLENFQQVGIKTFVEQGLPEIYNYTRGMIMANTNMTLPEWVNIDFSSLEFFEVYPAIEAELDLAMRLIMSRTNTSYADWSNLTNFSDMERLLLVMSSVDYTGVGQRIMGNTINIISTNDKIAPFMHRLITEVFSAANITSGSEGLINSTTEYAVAGLQESLAEERSKANWTTFENSQKLTKVLMGVDLMKFANQMVAAVVKNQNAMISPTFKKKITDFMGLVSGGNVPAMVTLLEDELNMMVNMTFNREIPTELESVRNTFVLEVAVRLILKYNTMLNGGNSTALPFLEASNQNLSMLMDSEKFIYLVMSLDYRKIGEVVMADWLMDRLKSANGTITPQLKSVFIALTDLVPMSQMMVNLSIGVADAVFVDVNKQLKSTYKNFSQDPQWQKMANTEKMGSLLKDYDYNTTGEVLIWSSLEAADHLLPENATKVLNEFITRVGNTASVKEILDKARQEIVRMYPMMSWLTKDSMIPFYEMVDSYIRNSSQVINANWRKIDGKIPKLTSFFMDMAGADLTQSLMAALSRSSRNSLIQQFASGLPANLTTPMVEFMNILESDGLRQAMQDLLNQVVGNNTMLKMLLRAENSTITQSLVDTIMTTYDKLKASTGSEWRQLSSAEKAVRLFMELNPQALVADAFNAGQEKFTSTRLYYTNLLSPNISSQCSADLENFRYALMRISEPNNMWAMKMVDAWGKIPSGIMEGALVWPGDMVECASVKGHRVNMTTGEVIEWNVIEGGWGRAMIEMASLKFVTSSLFATSDALKIQLGYCLPKSCGYYDTIQMFNGPLTVIGGKVPDVLRAADYPSLKGDYKTDSKFIGVSAFFVALILMVAISSIIDRAVLLKREKKSKKDQQYAMNILSDSNKDRTVMYDGGEKLHFDNNGYTHDETATKANGDVEASAKMNGDIPSKVEHKKVPPGVGLALVKSFSLYENLPRLFDTTPKPNQLQALDGVRFLSMTWIILGHTYALVFIGPYIKNPRRGMAMGGKGDWTFMGIQGGLFAVDSFFVLSGLLVGYLFLKVMHKAKGKISCLTMTLYYVHRYIRLLPLLAASILVSIAYQNYLGTGPLNVVFKNPCETNWWTNLLYVNNLVGIDAQCNGVTWYLANDMQFYVISPLLLIPLYLVPKVGLTMIFALFGTHIGLTGWEWSKRTTGGSQFGDQTVFQDIYIKPWARIGPYLIGLVLAYMLFKKCKVKSGVIQAIWWVVSLGLIAICVYVPYDATKESGIISSSWDPTERAAYETLVRTAWALGLSWILFACNTGCGGVVGDMLNWSGWAPLSKLTYAAYLFHPFVMTINWNNRHTMVYVDHLSYFYDNMAFVTISYLVGGVMHLLLEAPMMGIEKIILPSNKR